MLSLELLESVEINFFSCLSVCAKDGFSLQAAMAATNSDNETAEETLNYLYRLSLLNYAPSKPNRFLFHALIRLFAQERAIERSLQNIAAERHAKFYIAFVKNNDVNDPDISQFISEELEDILLAAEWLQRQNKADYQLAIKLGSFFTQHGYWRRAFALMTGFLELAERIEDWNAAVQFHIQQAKYQTLLGEWTKAYEAIKPISDILVRIEDETTHHHLEALYLNTLGGVLQRQGIFDDALDAFKRSAQIEEELGNPRGQAMVLNSLGGVLQRQGKLDDALDAFKRSYAILEKSGDERSLAMVLNSLGGVLQRQNKFVEAADVFQKSIKIGEKLGDKRHLAMVLNSLGVVLHRQGKFDDALDAFKWSAQIEEELGNLRGQAMVHTSMGKTLLAGGDVENAVTELRRGF